MHQNMLLRGYSNYILSGLVEETLFLENECPNQLKMSTLPPPVAAPPSPEPYISIEELSEDLLSALLEPC